MCHCEVKSYQESDFHSEMLFIRETFAQKPEIIKLPATELWRVKQDNFLTVPSLGFPESIKTVQNRFLVTLST